MKKGDIQVTNKRITKKRLKQARKRFQDFMKRIPTDEIALNAHLTKFALSNSFDPFLLLKTANVGKSEEI